MAESKSNANNDVTMAVLAYFIFFLPLLTAKDSKLAMFHANQSLVLLLAWIISAVVGTIIPVVGWIVAPIVGLGVLVLWIMGIIQAAQGQMKALPLVGTIKIIK